MDFSLVSALVGAAVGGAGASVYFNRKTLFGVQPPPEPVKKKRTYTRKPKADAAKVNPAPGAVNPVNVMQAQQQQNGLDKDHASSHTGLL